MHLIIDTRGTYLGCSNGMFTVKRYDGKSDSHAARRVESISVKRGCRVSTDAIALAVENDIPIVFTRGVGRAYGQVWSGKFGSIATLRRKQLRFSHSDEGLRWMRALVARKTANQRDFLVKLKEGIASPALTEGIARLRDAERKATKAEGSYVSLPATLRGIEGTASRYYFAALSAALPPHWQFGERGKRPAKMPFNAALNYLYGMLYPKVELAIIRAGLDLAIGVMHADQHNKPVLTFDLIEPYRTWADRCAFRLFYHDAFVPTDFTPDPEGGLLLNADVCFKLSDFFNRYLDEVVSIGKLSRSRHNHLDKEAVGFANRVRLIPL